MIRSAVLGLSGRSGRRERLEGVVKPDRRTKRLVRRLNPGDIALIDHLDIDRLSAEGLVESGTAVVLNARQSLSGRYPNSGPSILHRAGVTIVDLPDDGLFHQVSEGDVLTVAEGKVYRDGKLLAEGVPLTEEMLLQRLAEANHRLGAEVHRFALNTLEFLRSEAQEHQEIPHCDTVFQGRQALVVVRGYDYKEDLRTLGPYIAEMRPVLVGVDGGADALIEAGHRPDLIIGDMDSVTDRTLSCGAELMVHAYSDGNAPGRDRLEQLGLPYKLFPARGTSEDITFLLAYERGAELIVAVGTHGTLVEFLDKGREGMASTFLTRLKVGSRLVDAKGVSKLYRSKVKVSYLTMLLLAGILTLAMVTLVSPAFQQLLSLVIIELRLLLGI